jgi:hypothetical protein
MIESLAESLAESSFEVESLAGDRVFSRLIYRNILYKGSTWIRLQIV